MYKQTCNMPDFSYFFCLPWCGKNLNQTTLLLVMLFQGRVDRIECPEMNKTAEERIRYHHSV